MSLKKWENTSWYYCFLDLDCFTPTTSLSKFSLSSNDTPILMKLCLDLLNKKLLISLKDSRCFMSLS